MRWRMAILGPGLLLAGLAGAAAPKVLTGRVVEVADGDTISIRADGGQVKVRLHGVDAPEREQPFGVNASRALRQWTLGRTVVVTVLDRDQYDREVGMVYLDGEVLNARLIRKGYAWAYRQFLDEPPGARDYCRLENEAREARRGLWGQADNRIVPPWQWRRQNAGERVEFTRTGDLSLQNCLDAIPRRRNAPVPAANMGDAPQGCQIKGNINAKGARLYHLPGSRSYAETRIDPTKGERLFCTEDEARAAGWEPAR